MPQAKRPNRNVRRVAKRRPKISKWLIVVGVLLVALAGYFVVRFTHASASSYTPDEFQGTVAGTVHIPPVGPMYWHAVGSHLPGYPNDFGTIAYVTNDLAANVTPPAQTFCASFTVVTATAAIDLFAINSPKAADGTYVTGVGQPTSYDKGPHVVCQITTATPTGPYGGEQTLWFGVQSGTVDVYRIYDQAVGQ